MKKAFFVYFSDKTAKCVIMSDLTELSSLLSSEDFDSIVKVELVPFELI